MNADTSRRAFCVASFAFAASPAIPLAVEKRTADPIPGLVAEYLRLEIILAELWERRDAAAERAEAVIGECDMSSRDANRAWWDRYRQTEAWTLEGEWEDLAAGQCRIMERIIDTRSASHLGMVAKLRLWQQARDYDAEGCGYLIQSVMEDLEALHAAA